MAGIPQDSRMWTLPKYRPFPRYRMIAVIALFSLPAAHAQIYKWTDAAGTVHYSQTPPASGDFHEMPAAVPPSSSAEESEQQMQALIKRQQESEQDEQDEKARAQAEAARQLERIRLCAKAQKDLKRLQTIPSHRLLARKDGELIGRMTEDQRQDQIATLEKIMQDNCD
jgi:hypothetical protein